MPPPLLKINSATLVKNSQHILHDLHLEIADGQHTAILGPNGCGKSSLIQLITRHYYPLAHADSSPAITLFGQDRWDIFSLRQMMGIVSSDLHQEFVGFGGLTGREAVLSGFFASLGLARHQSITKTMHEHAGAMLELLEATHLAEKPMEQMSTGEARRILIARALVPDPHALLLDEPTTGLDILSRQRFLETLRRVIVRQKTLILVTHHAEEILPEIDRVVLMQNGRIFRDGPKKDTLTSEALSALYGAPIYVHSNGDYFRTEA